MFYFLFFISRGYMSSYKIGQKKTYSGKRPFALSLFDFKLGNLRFAHLHNSVICRRYVDINKNVYIHTQFVVFYCNAHSVQVMK